MSVTDNADLQAVLDGLGQGVLIFSSEGKLLVDNLAARTILGTDINVLRSDGWQAASVLFKTKEPDESIDKIRAKALQDVRPVRFHIYRSGEYVPCWVAAVQAQDGRIYTMITLDSPDWNAMTDLLDRFRGEIRESIDSTQGHIDLIMQSIKAHDEDDPVDKLQKRLSGFARLISIHMNRTSRLMDMLDRLQNIRTGELRILARQRRKKINLEDFMEDLLEELDEISLVDPETDATDHRSRITLNVSGGMNVLADPRYLKVVLHDLLRNAIMYSMKAAPVKMNVQKKNNNIQIDVVDEGYGIREKERERIFEPFQRARQPQVISEFGYGLSLYLCKHEVEAMNGRLWFESTEGVGTTMSFMLPVWVDESASSESSSSSSASDASSDDASSEAGLT